MLRVPLPPRTRQHRLAALLMTIACIPMASVATAGSRASRFAPAAESMASSVSEPRSLLQAAEAFDFESYEKAIDRATIALRQRTKGDDRHVAFYIVYASHLRLGQYEQAVHHSTRAIELGGERKWQHLNNRAHARIRLGDLDGAASDLRTAMSLIEPGTRTGAFTVKGRPATHSTLASNLDAVLRASETMDERVAERRAQQPAPPRSTGATEPRSRSFPAASAD